MAMTMLQMAGAAPTPATMADGVLVIIDAQREYTDGLLPLTGVAAAVDALALLLEKARKAKAPIVHVRHKGSTTGKAFNPTLSGFEIVKALTPRDGEMVIDKGLPNAFTGTDLAKHLQGGGRKNLIVGGFMTHMCVSATVRSATDHGFMSGWGDGGGRRDQPHHAGGAVRPVCLGRAEGQRDRLIGLLPSREGGRRSTRRRRWRRLRAVGRANCIAASRCNRRVVCRCNWILRASRYGRTIGASMFITLCPRAVNTPSPTVEMSVTIRVYSMAVAAVSSATRRRKIDNMIATPVDGLTVAIANLRAISSL